MKYGAAFVSLGGATVLPPAFFGAVVRSGSEVILGGYVMLLMTKCSVDGYTGATLQVTFEPGGRTRGTLVPCTLPSSKVVGLPVTITEPVAADSVQIQMCATSTSNASACLPARTFTIPQS